MNHKILRLTPLILTLFLIGCISLAKHTPEGLEAAADQTSNAYFKAVREGKEKRTDSIPERYWSSEISKLNPIEVYTHRVNVVVVTHRKGKKEKGYYITLRYSSYIPQDGDSGFEFGHGFNYTRNID